MDLPLLYELQELHKELDAIVKKLKELSEGKELRKLKDEYQRLKEEYLKEEERLKKNAYRQEMRNNEIKNLDFNKKACEDIKFSRETDTMKKLENIEKQLDTLAEKKQAAENDIITLIDEADNINKEAAETKKRLAFIKKKYLSSKESGAVEIAKLQTRKSELDQNISSLEKKLSQQSLEMYGRLRKSHADPVARVENRMCSGCKMEVPAMDYEAIRSGSQELRCQSCGRLLYFAKL